MTRSHLVGVLAAAGAVGGSVHPWSLPVIGAGVILVTAVTVVRLEPPARSRWRRGWWAVALALVPVTLAATPDLLADGLEAPLGFAAATAILLGVTGALPSRDPAHTRSVVAEAGIAGVLVAYLVGAALLIGTDDGAGAHAVALAAEIAALWVLLLLLRRERDLSTRADRLMAGAVAGLVAARVALLVAALGGPGWLVTVAAGALGAALVVWGAALRSPVLAEEPPPFAPPEAALHVGHVLLVVGGVVAGPTAILAHALLRGSEGLLLLGASGALLAMAAVLHLLQLVRDHGQRAWRARHDALTELPTEPLFEDRLEQAMARARRSGSGLAVAFLDLDGFKRVNDRDGHETGDAVLRAVALRLRSALREQDTVARKSGDEFLMLLPGVDDPADAERVATKLLAALRAPIEVGDQRHRIGASVGLALWPRDGATAEELIRHADAAMYEAKESRGGQLRWYTTATTARTRLRLTLAQQLELALETTDQIELAYQPRIDLRDGRVVGLVALVRWRHPELGLLTPRSFLPIAAEAGLTADVDRHVLLRACADAALLRADALLDVPVAVHLSDTHLANPRLGDDVVRSLRYTGLPPERLVLAVTETGLERGAEPTLRTLADLAGEGVGIVVSRFGTGAVSLSTLAAVPASHVELASAHIAGTNGALTEVTQAALSVADRFGFVVTANGVDSDAQVAALREGRCTTARGPHLAPPLFGETLAERLSVLAHDGDHDPMAVPVARLLIPTDAASPERPELAAVLAAAVRVDSEVAESDLTDVLMLLGHADPDPHPLAGAN